LYIRHYIFIDINIAKRLKTKEAAGPSLDQSLPWKVYVSGFDHAKAKNAVKKRPRLSVSATSGRPRFVNGRGGGVGFRARKGKMCVCKGDAKELVAAEI
jgi:hypothetical protein